jgi:hypothetical protein
MPGRLNGPRELTWTVRALSLRTSAAHRVCGIDEDQAQRARRIDFWLFVSVWVVVFAAAGIAILLQSK